MTGASSFQVAAAGGVVMRDGKVAVVHRPRYDDWSLPKGKLDPGEDFLAAAIREVREEIGAEVRVGRELPAVEYADHEGRRKLVRYWLMEAERVDFTPNEEVDELRWLDPARARDLLTYPRDRDVLDSAA